MIKQELIEQIVNEVVSEIDKIKNDVPLIEVEASARHIHLSQSDFEKLFGKNSSPTFVSELSQPGQFLARERVSIKGPKGQIDRIAILGPVRQETQIEISLSDARILGVPGVLRNSGSIEGTPALQVCANNHAIELDKGVIVAKRHIHVHRDDAIKFSVKDKDIVSVQILSNRPLIFNDVLIRVSDQFKTSMHIDFDEANACHFQPKKTFGRIIKDE